MGDAGHRSVASDLEAGLDRLGVVALEAARALGQGHAWEMPFIDATREAFDCDAVGGITWDLHTVTRSQSVFCTGIEFDEASLPAMGAAMLRHPSLPWLTDPRRDVAHRVSDVVDLARFRDTDVFDVVHAWSGARYPAALRLLATPGTVVFIGLQRATTEFTERELDRLRALSEPLSSGLRYRVLLDAAWAAVSPGAEADVVLTRREKDVVALVARGWTNHRIGHALGISERTVRKHLDSMRSKIHAGSRSEAAVWWVGQTQRG